MCVHESLPCGLLVHAGCMLPEKCSLWFTREIAIATASRSRMAAGTRSVWVSCGMRNSGDRNCSLPLLVLVNNDLLQRSAHVGQFYLLCHVVSRVVIHHVLLSDSRPEDLGWGQEQRGSQPIWRIEELHSPVGGKHGIAAYRLWFTLTSLPFQTRVFQYLDEPHCKLKNLVCSDFSSFTHVFALGSICSFCLVDEFFLCSNVSLSIGERAPSHAYSALVVAAQRRVVTGLRVRCEKVVSPSSQRPQV